MTTFLRVHSSGGEGMASATTPLGGGDIQVHSTATRMAIVVRPSGSASSGGTSTSGTSQPAPSTGSSPPASSPPPVVTSMPAASVSSGPSTGLDIFALEASWLDTLEHDLSQWEALMTQELDALVQTIDQLFMAWDPAALDSPGSVPPATVV